MAFGDDHSDPASGPEEDEEFGLCCTELKEALAGEDFEPLIAVGEDGVLYMSIGMVELEDAEPGMVDHPVFYCPFCGTEVQTEEEVAAKADSDEDSEEDDDDDESESDDDNSDGNRGFH